MKSLKRSICLAPIVLLLTAPGAAVAEERAVSEPEKKPEERALLLPAVQKAKAPEPETEAATKPGRAVAPTPQKGIEPDEIDAKNRARAPGSPGRGRRNGPPSACCSAAGERPEAVRAADDGEAEAKAADGGSRSERWRRRRWPERPGQTS
jgi:hypothetical protein